MGRMISHRIPSTIHKLFYRQSNQWRRKIYFSAAEAVNPCSARNSAEGTELGKPGSIESYSLQFVGHASVHESHVTSFREKNV